MLVGVLTEIELDRLKREAEMIMWYVDVSMRNFIEDLRNRK
jgi:hypothetical protein